MHKFPDGKTDVARVDDSAEAWSEGTVAFGSAHISGLCRILTRRPGKSLQNRSPPVPWMKLELCTALSWVRNKTHQWTR